MDQEGAPAFRPDLQGLRAVAIVLVVLFHAEVPGLDGGFVGVDVFFVISGFLITTSLGRDLEHGGPARLGAFWARRIRRLVPALALVVATVSLASLAVLSPLEVPQVARDGASSMAYVSNLVFARRATDYFADPGPGVFLHTWSLGVEEQFYLCWPLLLGAVAWAARRTGRRPRIPLLVAVAATTVLSIAVAVELTDRGTPWAFFSLPSRAFEFGIGGLLALTSRPGPSRDSAGRRPTAALGLGLAGAVLLGWSVATFDGLTPFPGTAALVPALGTLALVAAARLGPSVLTSALGTRPLVWVGDRSYTWYLWHWPVLVLAAAAWPGDRPAVRAAAVLVSLGLADLTTRGVERRWQRSLALRRSVARTFGAGFAAVVGTLIVVGVVAVAADRRADGPLYRRLAHARADIDYHRWCDGPTVTGADCVAGPASARHTVVVVGDSHALMWAPALAGATPSTRIVIRSRGGCPASDVRIAKAGTLDDSSACEAYRRGSLALVDRLQPDLVVLIDAGYLGRILDGGRVPSATRQVGLWRFGLRRTIERYRRTAPVALVSPGPQLARDPIVCAGREGSLATCTPARTDALAAVAPLRRALRTVAASTGSPVLFDAADLECGRRRCLPIRDDRFVLADTDHVTASFARAQRAALAPRLAHLLQGTRS